MAEPFKKGDRVWYTDACWAEMSPQHRGQVGRRVGTISAVRSGKDVDGNAWHVFYVRWDGVKSSVAELPENLERPYASCPFCGEIDFDLIGLKLHLIHGWCAVYEETPLKDPQE